MPDACTETKPSYTCEQTQPPTSCTISPTLNQATLLALPFFFTQFTLPQAVRIPTSSVWRRPVTMRQGASPSQAELGQGTTTCRGPARKYPIHGDYLRGFTPFNLPNIRLAAILVTDHGCTGGEQAQGTEGLFCSAIRQEIQPPQMKTRQM